MYKILIVDDEEYICRGLKSMIERINNPEIGEIFMAFDGDEAEVLAAKVKPQLIITDIRMPNIDGLTLIRRVMQMDRSTRFVVLSGFDDFSYAKEAIKLGVVDYLLKPASLEELKEVLKKISDQLKEQSSFLKNKDDAKYQQVLFESSINRLFTGVDMSEEQIQGVLEELANVFSYSCFAVGVVFPANNRWKMCQIAQKADIVYEADEKAAIRMEKNVSFKRHYAFHMHDRLLIIANLQECRHYPAMVDYMKEFQAAVNELSGYDCTLAVSNAKEGIKSLPALYLEAVKAYSYRILHPGSCVLEFTGIQERVSPKNVSSAKMAELSEHIRFFRKERVSNLIDDLFKKENLEAASIESVEALYISIAVTLRNIFDSRPGYVKHEYREFSTLDSLSEVRIYLKKTIFSLMDNLLAEERDKHVVDIAKKYILENYSKDINLAVVANMVSMNYSYFSKLFKEKTGMNYVDYLMKYRMEIAEKLLGDPVNKINEISLQVGYENPKHFARAFKNYFGISPREYKAGKPIKS